MNKNEFNAVLHEMEEYGHLLTPNRVSIHIPNAMQEMKDCISQFISTPVWLPEYNKVASWLTDNKKKGLLCIGNCGRGKTILCRWVIPMLIYHFCRRHVSVYDAIDINTKIDEMKIKHLLSIDDIGTESDYFVYGVRRQPFQEIADSAEKTGKLLLITTNLTISQIQEKYGIRTLDRLRKVTSVVEFIRKSYR